MAKKVSKNTAKHSGDSPTKAPAKTGRKTGVLVPQKHGGALLNGMAKNHVPGPGRPPSALRETLRKSFDKRITILETIADGQLATAEVGDRIKAIDMLAKYGLGTTKEVSVEAVRDRVSRTLDVIRAHTTPKIAAAIIADLRPIWA